MIRPRARGVGAAMGSTVRGVRLRDLLVLLVLWAPLLFAWSPFLASYPRLGATYGGPFELSILLGDTAARMVSTPARYLVTWIPLGLAGLVLRQVAMALTIRRVVASREPVPLAKALFWVIVYSLLAVVFLGLLNALFSPRMNPLWSAWVIAFGLFATRYALVLPVLLAEEGGFRHALRRSRELTRESYSGIFLVHFWLVVLPAGILFVAALFRVVDVPGPPAAATMAMYAFATVFQAGFLGHLYRQTAGHESERIERVFE